MGYCFYDGLVIVLCHCYGLIVDLSYCLCVVLGLCDCRENSLVLRYRDCCLVSMLVLGVGVALAASGCADALKVDRHLA